MMKNLEDIFLRFNTIHERVGHTHTERETQTDTV